MCVCVCASIPVRHISHIEPANKSTANREREKKRNKLVGLVSNVWSDNNDQF